MTITLTADEVNLLDCALSTYICESYNDTTDAAELQKKLAEAHYDQD